MIKPYTDHRVANGFTLVELLVTLAIAAILTTIALPSFQEMIANNRISSVSNELLTSISTARTEAIKRGRSVTIQSNQGNTWEGGWQIFIDGNNNNSYDAGETLIQTYQSRASAATVRLASNPVAFITFGATGALSSPIAGLSFKICDSSAVVRRARGILLGPQGQASSCSLSTCPTLTAATRTCP